MEVAGVAPPNKRKFEEDVKAIAEDINELEDKIVSCFMLLSNLKCPLN